MKQRPSPAIGETVNYVYRDHDGNQHIFPAVVTYSSTYSPIIDVTFRLTEDGTELTSYLVRADHSLDPASSTWHYPTDKES